MFENVKPAYLPSSHTGIQVEVNVFIIIMKDEHYPDEPGVAFQCVDKQEVHGA